MSGVAWCGVAWCGVAWCGVMWHKCSVVWYDMMLVRECLPRE